MFSRRKRPKPPRKTWNLLGILKGIGCAVAVLFVPAAIALPGIGSLVGKPTHEADVVHVTETISANFTPVVYDLPSLTPQGDSVSAEFSSVLHFPVHHPHTHEDPYVQQILPQGGSMATGTASATNDLSADGFAGTSFFS